MGTHWESCFRISHFRQAVGGLVHSDRHLGLRDPDVYFRRVVFVEKSQPLPSGHVTACDAKARSLDRARFLGRADSLCSWHLWIGSGIALVRAAPPQRYSLVLLAWNSPWPGRFRVALRHR